MKRVYYELYATGFKDSSTDFTGDVAKIAVANEADKLITLAKRWAEEPYFAEEQLKLLTKFSNASTFIEVSVYERQFNPKWHSGATCECVYVDACQLPAKLQETQKNKKNKLFG